MMVFDNFGDYITSCSLDAVQLIEDLHRYCKGRSSSFYYDICVFADEKIFYYVRDEEIKFFNRYKL